MPRSSPRVPSTRSTVPARFYRQFVSSRAIKGAKGNRERVQGKHDQDKEWGDTANGHEKQHTFEFCAIRPAPPPSHRSLHPTMQRQPTFRVKIALVQPSQCQCRQWQTASPIWPAIYNPVAVNMPMCMPRQTPPPKVAGSHTGACTPHLRLDLLAARYRARLPSILKLGKGLVRGDGVYFFDGISARSVTISAALGRRTGSKDKVAKITARSADGHVAGIGKCSRYFPLTSELNTSVSVMSPKGVAPRLRISNIVMPQAQMSFCHHTR